MSPSLTPSTSKTSSKKRARTSNGNVRSKAAGNGESRLSHLTQQVAPDRQPGKSHGEPSIQGRTSSLVHECSFLRPHLPGVTALAVTPDGETMAVGRSDYSILLSRNLNLWTPIDEVLPRSGDPEQSVSCLQFTPCSNYLVAGRLNGTVTFWRIFECGLALHAELRPGGGAIWGMQFAPGCSTSCFRLAVACDDGAVRILSPDPEFNSVTLPSNEAHYIIKMTARAQARALSVTWLETSRGASNKIGKSPENRKSHEKVITGDSEGGVRVLSSQTGEVFGHGKIPPSDGAPVLIWTVQSVCKGRKIFCGDDRGIVTIWDSASLTMSSEISPHGVKGAIWCSTVLKYKPKIQHSSANGDRGTVQDVVVLGAANGRVSAIKSNDAHGKSWSNFRGNAVHTHDVRGLVAIDEDQFISGSIDSRIAVGSLKWFDQAKSADKVTWISTLNDLVGRKTVQVLRDHNLVVCRGTREIEVWYLSPTEGKFPKLLLRMKFDSGSDLRTCAMSQDCQMLALSDADSFRLYRIWDGVGGSPISAPSFGNVDLVDIHPRIEAALSGCIAVCFCKEHVVALTSNRMGVVMYDPGEDECKQYDMSTWKSKGLFLKHISCGHSTVAVLDSSNQVFICTVESIDVRWRSNVFFGNMPRAVLEFAISPSGEQVACSFPDGGILIAHTDCSKGLPSTHGQINGSPIVTCLSFGHSGNNLLASSNNAAFIISLTKSIKEKSEVGGELKRRKAVQLSNLDQVEGRSILKTWPIPASHPKLLSSGILSGGQILLSLREVAVMQTYLPDAIPAKPTTFNS